MSYLKIVDPLLPNWAAVAIAAAIFVLSVGIRRMARRIRPRVIQEPPSELRRPVRSRLLWLLVLLPVMLALLVRWGFLATGVMTPAIATYLGGMQMMRSDGAVAMRTRRLAVLSIVIAVIVTRLGDSVLDHIFAWSAGAAVLYLVVGLWVLRSYLRLPEQVPG